MNTYKNIIFVVILIFVFFTGKNINPSFAQIEKFIPRQGGTVEVWRITDDPTVRDWASYHSTPCFSPDGRYICYIHFAGNPDELKLPPKSEIQHKDLYRPTGTPGARKIRLYDLHKNEDRKINAENNNTDPKWANKHNWFFYTQSISREGTNEEKTTKVMWLDVDTGNLKNIGYGLRSLKYTDCDDRWLYGMITLADGEVKGSRIPIKENSKPEPLQGKWKYGGNLLYTNPVHPMIVSRDNLYKQHYYATKIWRPAGYLGTYDIPFVARHFFHADLEGGNRIVSYPEMEGAHFSWLGDGSYFLAGNGQFRGWKWNEPLPSNIHFLGAIRCSSDPSPCGRSGRWISGSSAGPMQIVDIRSGDGWNYLNALSHIHDSGSFSYCYGSGLSDNDAKGSPDGTKICFVTNYDLKDGPVTEILENVSGISGNQILVKSTDGFPKAGRITVRNEIIAYERKTPTSFEGLTRRLYNTHPVILEHLNPQRRKLYEERPVDLRKGQIVKSFDAICIPEDEWKKLPLPAKILKHYDGKITPLLRQAQTDVYVAVVRLPDRPHFRKAENEIELIPSENHWETYGYHIFKDSTKITDNPLRPGESFNFPETGTYTATAVEWSGLESKESLPVKIQNNITLKILHDKPADFSWTYDRWLVDRKEVSEEEAKNSIEAVREIVHLHDGVIHREWYNWGQIIKRYDLNLEWKPIRRLFYQNSKLTRRELHNRDGIHFSTEFFDPDGYITESIQYRMVSGELNEYRHWWYEKGVSVKSVRNSSGGAEIYTKDGNRWLKKITKVE